MGDVNLEISTPPRRRRPTSGALIGTTWGSSYRGFSPPRPSAGIFRPTGKTFALHLVFSVVGVADGCVTRCYSLVGVSARVRYWLGGCCARPRPVRVTFFGRASCAASFGVGVFGAGGFPDACPPPSDGGVSSQRDEPPGYVARE